MGLLNTILGRTKPVESNLDALFALPSASITLQTAANQVCSGHAGVCFKPPSGQGFEEMQAEVVKLLDMDGTQGLRKTEDSYGYHWLVVEDADIERLVTQIHMVNSSLSDAGWGPQLLCSVFGLARLGEDPLNAADPVDPVDPADQVSPDGLATSGDSGTGLVEGPGTVRPSSGYLVYLFKRGTFYPFIPDGHGHRDIEQELKLKSLVSGDLAVETDLDRWFPLWDLPVG
jgi:hypothetical protein